MKKPQLILVLCGLLSLSFSFVSMAAFICDGSFYEQQSSGPIFDPQTGCTYVVPGVTISGSTQKGQHSASSGKSEGSSFEDNWHLEEYAEGRVWIENGKTKENADVWIQENGIVVQSKPAKWEKDEPDRILDIDEGTPGRPSSDGTPPRDIEIDEAGPHDDSGDGVGENSNEPSGGKDPENTNLTIPGTSGSGGSDGSGGNGQEVILGGVEYEDGTIGGSFEYENGDHWDFTLEKGEDGKWSTESFYDEETGVTESTTITSEEDFTELEDFCYTFKGTNIDNDTLPASARTTNFNIGMWKHREDNFRFTLRTEGTWKIDCTYWELLGLYKRFTQQRCSTPPGGKEDCYSYTYTRKVGERVENEPAPNFPQYVPVAKVCDDCPSLEICVNGACDCIDNTNTICSNEDREEAEKQLNTYEVQPKSVLEK